MVFQSKALDLFSCAGGATRGLQLAGYHVTGVDIRPQPRYVGDAFHQDDAMAWLRGEREPLESFDLIWLSPPCQRYSQLTPAAYRDGHPDLLPVALDLARTQPTAYICENVEGTQILMRNPVMLCGTMFGLNIWRHRWFEVGNTDVFFLTPPCNHEGHPVLISGRANRKINGIRRGEDPKHKRAEAIRIDWMTYDELSQAIPPCYSRFLAEHILEATEAFV